MKEKESIYWLNEKEGTTKETTLGNLKAKAKNFYKSYPKPAKHVKLNWRKVEFKISKEYAFH